MGENCKFVNQKLHYRNELPNNFIVCHHKLSFLVTMTLFLFQGQMCHTTVEPCYKEVGYNKTLL